MISSGWLKQATNITKSTCVYIQRKSFISFQNLFLRQCRHFLIQSKINRNLYPQRVLLPWKKTPWYVLSFRCDKPLQIVMTVWRTFSWISACWVRCDSPLLTICTVWPSSNFEKVHHLANATVSPCSRLSHPTRSPSRIVCRGLEHPKCSKHTVRPDFQANTRPRIF